MERQDAESSPPAAGPTAGGALRAAPAPLLALASALAAGSLAGAELARGAPATAGALARVGASFPLLGILGAALLAGLLAGARRPRASAALLVALAGAAGLAQASRAALQLPRDSPAERTTAATEPPSSARAHEGELRILREDARGILARLEGTPEAGWLRLPFELARQGERVRILAGAPPTPPAQGPAGGARAGPRRVEPDELVRLEAARGPAAWLGEKLRTLRRAARARLEALAEPRARSLAAALVLGERELAKELETGLTDTGTLHLFVVSGLHVVLAAAFLGGPVGWLAARLARQAGLGPRRAATVADLARLGAIGLQCALAGGAPPVARAALAAAVWTWVPRADSPAQLGAPPRRTDALSLWSLALVLELLADPLAASLVGVQLSYGATLGLLVAARPLARELEARLFAGGARTSDQPLGAGAALARAGARPLLAGVAASLVAVLATLPIVWERFGRVAPLGVLGTLALSPLVLATLGMGWLALVEPGLVPLGLQRALASALEGGVRALDRLPGTPLALPERPLVLVLVASACALLALRAKGSANPRASRELARAACACFGLLLVPWSAAPRGLELVALDVGAGTAVLWRAPGAGTWIFDAGSRDRPGVARALERQLARWECERPGVIVSHEDRDHLGALERVLAARPPRLALGAVPAQPGERRAHGEGVQDLRTGGLRVALGPGHELELWRGLERAGNEGSRVARLSWRGLRLLLCGDAEAEGLLELLALGALDGPSELLLWPHHGAQTRAPGELLGRARPREVWVSGSPPTSIAAELARRGQRWRSTAEEGPLVLELADRRPPEPGRLAWTGGGMDPALARHPSPPPQPTGAGDTAREERALDYDPSEEDP